MKNRTEMQLYLIKRLNCSPQWLAQRTDEQLQYLYEMFKDEESVENEELETLNP